MKRRILAGLDLLALLGIGQGLWGIDIAIVAPQLLMIHYGYYLALMYIQIGVAGVWLYLRLILGMITGRTPRAA